VGIGNIGMLNVGIGNAGVLNIGFGNGNPYALDAAQPNAFNVGGGNLGSSNVGFGNLGDQNIGLGNSGNNDIGIDNIAWECDYPHSDSSWPAAPEELAGVTADVPDDEVNKITYENACRWYNFDPFKHRSREQCTVGALRAEAGDHDVAIRTFDHGRFERTVGVSLGSMSAKLNV